MSLPLPTKPGSTSATYAYGFAMPEEFLRRTDRGVNAEIVRQISNWKDEPDWMRDHRLAALAVFEQKAMPSWGADLSAINFQDFTYYLKPTENAVRSWDDVPANMKETYDRIGVPQAEREFLAGVGAQYDSEVIYHSLQETLTKQGVIFMSMDAAVKAHPEIVKQYFGTLIPAADNKFAALNTAVWSGGSFVYVPRGVKCTLPLQAYFRINARQLGQFERTLIVAEEGSFVHYVEGCTAPVYSAASLHAAVVEIFVKPGARVRYTTIQNWSTDVYNLVTKRAQVDTEGVMEWIDGNLGSKVTMKYPSVYLIGPKARGEVLSVAAAGPGQHLDAGAKAIHVAPETSSLITAKSIARAGGRTSYRGLVHVTPNAHGSKVNVQCDALLLDPESRSDTYPTMKIRANDVSIAHEASVSRVGEEQLFYLQSRGLTPNQATGLIVSGFIEPIVRELPFEYAVELNHLIQLNMEGSVG